MQARSVTVRLTPRQAVEAAEALQRAGVREGKVRLFAAGAHIRDGLSDAGWRERNVGTDDDPMWMWEHPAA